MINLTPHAIVLRTPIGDLTFPPSDNIARVSTVAEVVAEFCPSNCNPMQIMQVVRNTYGPVNGLQRDERGLIKPCLVSAMVLAALPEGTPNVYAPDTGPSAIRDDKGHIVAVTRLVCK